MTPEIIERVTHIRWPAAPADYTNVQARWAAIQAAYQAQRITEIEAAKGRREKVQ